MAELARKKTKLEKHYYQMRLVTVGVNYCFVLSLICMVLAFSFMILPIFIFLYIVYALIASVVLIVCTLFLVLINAGDPSNPLNIVWSRLNKIDEVLQPVIHFAAIAVPIIGGCSIALSILLLVLVNKNLGRSNKIKDNTLLILSIIFSVIAIFVSQVVAYS